MTNDQQTIERKVMECISEITNTPAEEIKGYQLLNDELGIDSIRILELLSYIEDAFHFELEVDDIQPENFSSVQSVIQFVEGKLAK